MNMVWATYQPQPIIAHQWTLGTWRLPYRTICPGYMHESHHWGRAESCSYVARCPWDDGEWALLYGSGGKNFANAHITSQNAKPRLHITLKLSHFIQKCMDFRLERNETTHCLSVKFWNVSSPVNSVRVWMPSFKCERMMIWSENVLAVFGQELTKPGKWIESDGVFSIPRTLSLGADPQKMMRSHANNDEKRFFKPKEGGDKDVRRGKPSTQVEGNSAECKAFGVSK